MARAEARSPASGEPCAARRVAARPPRASTAPPGVRVAPRQAGRGRRGLEGRLGDAREGEEPRGGGRPGRAVEERPGEAVGRRVEPQLVEGAGERVLEVPGEEPVGDLGPLPDDPVDPCPVDGRDELGELEREGLVGKGERPRRPHRTRSASATAGRAHAGASAGEAERRAKAATRRSQAGPPAFDPLPQLRQERVRARRDGGPRGGAAPPSPPPAPPARRRRRGASRSRAPAGSVDRPVEDTSRRAPRGGARARPSRHPWRAARAVSSRRSCSTTRAAAAGSEPSSSGITAREISVKRSSNRADSLPSRPRSPPSGSGKISFQRAERDGPHEAARVVDDLGHGERLPLVSAVAATAPSGRRRGGLPSGWGRTSRVRPSPQASSGSGTKRISGRSRRDRRVAPRAGEEDRDAARARRRAAAPRGGPRAASRPPRESTRWASLRRGRRGRRCSAPRPGGGARPRRRGTRARSRAARSSPRWRGPNRRRTGRRTAPPRCRSSPVRASPRRKPSGVGAVTRAPESATPRTWPSSPSGKTARSEPSGSRRTSRRAAGSTVQTRPPGVTPKRRLEPAPRRRSRGRAERPERRGGPPCRGGARRERGRGTGRGGVDTGG